MSARASQAAGHLDWHRLAGRQRIPQPYGMNNRGEVIGLSAIQCGVGLYNAFLYNGGTMTNLGTFGGEVSGPTA